MSFPIRRKGVVKRTVKKGNVLTKASRPHCPWPTLQQCETPLHSRSLVEFPAAPTEPRQYPAGNKKTHYNHRERKIICAVVKAWYMGYGRSSNRGMPTIIRTVYYSKPYKNGENHPQYGYLPVSSNVAIGAKSPN